jgi:hypothetical protein
MSPWAKETDLLYVSSNIGNGSVYVYSFQRGRPVGTLTGFLGPSGECVDKVGDVFITNYSDADILEYAHGGTEPIATLEDQPYSNPIDCSIDPTSGDLAVANDFGGSGDGNVVIFPHAGGAPQYYSDPTLFSVNACAYDDAGDLFVDGMDNTLRFALAELSKDRAAFRAISVPKDRKYYDFPIQWDGRYLAVGYGADVNVMRRLRITGSKADIAGSVTLTDGYSVDYFSIVRSPGTRGPTGAKLVGPEYNSGNAKIWNYPAGGMSVRTIGGAGVPVGTAVSLAVKTKKWAPTSAPQP